MATASKFANANTTITTGWSSPTNGYADDAAYSTAAPAKSASITTDWGFAAFSTSDIPAGSVINSVTIEIQYKSNTTSSTGAVIGLQINNNGSLLGSESTFGMNLSDQTVTKQATSGISLADLRNANGVKGRVRGFRSTSNTAITWSVDYVKITVDYTATTSGSLSETQAAQTGSMAGAAKSSGAATEANAAQTEVSAGATRVSTTAGETSAAQTEAATAAVTASVAVDAGQSRQSEGISGAALASASIDALSAAQDESLSAEALGAGGIAEGAAPQLSAAEGLVAASAALLEEHGGQSETIEAVGPAEDPTTSGEIVESQPAQTGSIAASTRSSGVANEVGLAQTDVAEGCSEVHGCVLERQRRQVGTVTATVATDGLLLEEQPAQECLGAAMVYRSGPLGVRIGVGI